MTRDPVAPKLMPMEALDYRIPDHTQLGEDPEPLHASCGAFDKRWRCPRVVRVRLVAPGGGRAGEVRDSVKLLDDRTVPPRVLALEEEHP